MYRRFIAIAAWMSLGFIAFSTMSPAGLRPQIASVGFEHVAAFAVVGVLFAIAYPRRLLPIVALVLGSAIVLELVQLLTPDRHARLSDLLVKLGGGSIGIAVARFWDRG
jgi:VanZ family protein